VGVEIMGFARVEPKIPGSSNENSVLNLNSIKTKRLFAKIKGLGFSLLSTGITRAVIKAPLTLLDAPKGELELKDPVILLSLDVLGQSKGVLYLSFQVPREEVIAKMVMALSGVNETMVKKGALITEAQEAFEKACSIIYNSNFHVAEGEISSNFWIKVQELKQKNLIDMVIVDDLHAVSFEMSKSETAGFQDVLEHFNEMALNVGVPVVLISRTL
jgi:hypothetical protein